MPNWLKSAFSPHEFDDPLQPGIADWVGVEGIAGDLHVLRLPAAQVEQSGDAAGEAPCRCDWLQVRILATDGSVSVQMPVEVLFGEPQKRSEDSHATTPDQLLVNVFPEMVSVLMPAVFGTLAVTAGLGEVDRALGEAAVGRAHADRVGDKRVVCL